MKIKIKTAIIPIAGKGTRLMPLTLKTDKSFLKINNKPILWYILKEAIDSGITKIIIVVNFKTKQILKEYIFKIKKTLLSNVIIKIIVQKKLLGLENSIIISSKYVKNDYFALMLGDNIFQINKPPTIELIDLAQKNKKNVIGIVNVPISLNNQYGILENNYIIEKPQNSKSNLAIMGRYIFHKNIFIFLVKNSHKNNSLINYMNLQIKNSKLLTYKINAHYFDIGNFEGFKEANEYFT